MGSIFARGNRLYAKIKDARGKWRDKASSARTKTEAKRLAGEVWVLGIKLEILKGRNAWIDTLDALAKAKR